MKIILSSLRIVLVTAIVCCVIYPVLVFAVARIVAPVSAEGSLVRAADGTVVGSRRIAQAFTEPRYFWPRPSAVNYNAAAAGGSNLSPASAKLAERARATLAAYGASADRPAPADLVAASGSGLDPDISLVGAEYQVARVAVARGLTEERVRALIDERGEAVGGAFAPERTVNVLELNLALDRMAPR